MLIRIVRATVVVRGPVRAGTAVMEVLRGWWKQSLPKWATQRWERAAPGTAPWLLRRQ